MFFNISTNFLYFELFLMINLFLILLFGLLFFLGLKMLDIMHKCCSLAREFIKLDDLKMHIDFDDRG
jgi:hypothetical protein